MEWISIKNKLPTEQEDVLTYGVVSGKKAGKEYSPVYVGFYECGAFYSSYDYYENNIYISLYNVTHWMPLPEPPKEG